MCWGEEGGAGQGEQRGLPRHAALQHSLHGEDRVRGGQGGGVVQRSPDLLQPVPPEGCRGQDRAARHAGRVAPQLERGLEHRLAGRGLPGAGGGSAAAVTEPKLRYLRLEWRMAKEAMQGVTRTSCWPGPAGRWEVT